MRLTSLADYAVVMMAAAARHAGDERLSATLLSCETGVPLPTAQKLMGKLASAGLLRSARGTGGGFELARSAPAISLAEIIEAVEGPIALTACAEHSRQECALDHACRVKPHLSMVNGIVREALQNISLFSLSRDLPSSARPEPVEGPSFSSLNDSKGRASTSSARTGL